MFECHWVKSNRTYAVMHIFLFLHFHKCKWTTGQRTTSKMLCSRREFSRGRPDRGHKTEKYGLLLVKPLHLTVEDVRLIEVKSFYIL